MMALEILGIQDAKYKELSSIGLIKKDNLKLFRKRSLLYHPDKMGGNGSVMSMMNQLWKILDSIELTDSLFKYGFNETYEYYNGGVPKEAELETIMGLLGPATPEPESQEEIEVEIEVDIIEPEPEEQRGRQRAHQAKTTSAAKKSRVSSIVGHRNRGERDGLRYQVVWEGLEELGAIWETPETLLEADPAALKEYIKSKGTKSRGAQLKACPRLFELFRK